MKLSLSSLIHRLGARHLLGLGLLALAVAACVPLGSASGGQSFRFPGASFKSNGEQIYFTGVNQDGERINYTGGPAFGGMMGRPILTCASCHGPTAQGGRHTMHMIVMDAPDIRIAALAAEEEGEEGHGGGGGYTLEDFRRAVVEGRHPDGKPMDTNMPRWQLSDRDLEDLYNYLNSLPYP